MSFKMMAMKEICSLWYFYCVIYTLISIINTGESRGVRLVFNGGWGRWFVSSCTHMNGRIKCFAAELCTVLR